MTEIQHLEKQKENRRVSSLLLALLVPPSSLTSLCLEKEMATHSSILAWRIPWIGEPDGLQSTGLQRVGHN